MSAGGRRLRSAERNKRGEIIVENVAELVASARNALAFSHARPLAPLQNDELKEIAVIIHRAAGAVNRQKSSFHRRHRLR